MKNILVLSTILLCSVVTCLADPVAVFDIQWGKGKDRQTRSFAIGFYDADAPRTTANFKKLVQDGFYKKTTFHRVFPNYLVQGGDPLSKDWAEGYAQQGALYAAAQVILAFSAAIAFAEPPVATGLLRSHWD